MIQLTNVLQNLPADQHAHTHGHINFDIRLPIPEVLILDNIPPKKTSSEVIEQALRLGPDAGESQSNVTGLSVWIEQIGADDSSPGVVFQKIHKLLETMIHEIHIGMQKRHVFVL